jgi:hypothetical protein
MNVDLVGSGTFGSFSESSEMAGEVDFVDVDDRKFVDGEESLNFEGEESFGFETLELEGIRIVF